MRAVVNCPAKGEMPTNTCQDWRRQTAKFSNHNTECVTMFRACARCPVNRKDDANG